MGNWNNRPTWLSSNAQQLPGLITTSIKQITGNVEQGKTTNIPFEFTKEQFASFALIIDGLTSPVSFVHAGGNRFYIVDQIGYIYIYDRNRGKATIEKGVGTIYQGDQLQPLLIDLTKSMTKINGMYDERGLLQMILHPLNNLFYIYYTIDPPSDANYNCVAVLDEWRFEHQGERAVHIRHIVKWPHPEANHFGSPIGFGLDGLLYFATGDGGGAGDKHGSIGNAHDTTNPWGKILTIDINQSDPVVEIMAIGFRNPWRGSFTSDGAIIIGEVGQDKYEGIHIVRANEDHGWRAFENGHIYDPELALFLQQKGHNITVPVLWYERPFGRAIIGGYQLNEQADYIFGDFTGGLHGDNVYPRTLR